MSAVHNCGFHRAGRAELVLSDRFAFGLSHQTIVMNAPNILNMSIAAQF